MNPIPTTLRSQPFQRLHPLSLLAQLMSRQTTGCLQVLTPVAAELATDSTCQWAIYLDQGKLAYATYSNAPFERLDRHLSLMGQQIPGLVSAVRVQTRLLFETDATSDFATNADYRAIRWLVEQQYLNQPEAALLIENLAKEVIEAFLTVQEGSHEVQDWRNFQDYPNLCQLELRTLVEDCLHQLRRRQVSKPVQTFAPTSEPPTPLRGMQRIAQITQNTSRSPKPAMGAFRGYEPSPGTRSMPPTEIQAKTRYTIACIDDSPTILEAIRGFLDDSSFSVLMINDPVKALMQVVRSKPDLILLDVGMPNLDGYELCSLLRRHPLFKQTPIIMVTGLTGFIDRAKARLVGASGYLTKPFTQSELLKTVFKHLT